MGDFNGDGNQDLAVANGLLIKRVNLVWGNGAGSFSACHQLTGPALNPRLGGSGRFQRRWQAGSCGCQLIQLGRRVDPVGEWRGRFQRPRGPQLLASAPTLAPP